MSKHIQSFLISRYPQAKTVFRSVGVLPKLTPRSMALPEAVVRVVVGQMLSSKSARTIYARLKDAADANRLAGTWQLEEMSLRGCGLSRSKTRAIKEFGAALNKDPRLMDDWPALAADELLKRINSFWGMSDWTASILAISYLGHEDVFPSGDSSLRKAIAMIEKASPRRKLKIDPAQAHPYRSYLALYLWKALDQQLIKSV